MISRADNLLEFGLEDIRSVDPLASGLGVLAVPIPSAKPDDPPHAAKSQATEIVKMALEDFDLRVNPDCEAFVVTGHLPHLASQLRSFRPLRSQYRSCAHPEPSPLSPSLSRPSQRTVPRS